MKAKSRATPGARNPRAAFSVLGLDHVVLRVRDLDASVKFYRYVLGARVERRLRTPILVQLRLGDSLLDLVPGRRGEGRNLDHYALRVAALDPAALARRLARYGIEAGAVAERYGAEGYGPSLYFNDPDANTVELKGPAVRPRIALRVKSSRKQKIR